MQKSGSRYYSRCSEQACITIWLPQLTTHNVGCQYVCIFNKQFKLTNIRHLADANLLLAYCMESNTSTAAAVVIPKGQFTNTNTACIASKLET